jgi:hypothetical protein
MTGKEGATVDQALDQAELVGQRSIGLKPSHHEALRRIAILEGHTSRSRVVQRLVETEAERVLGAEWAETVTKPIALRVVAS